MFYTISYGTSSDPLPPFIWASVIGTGTHGEVVSSVQASNKFTGHLSVFEEFSIIGI